MAKWCGNIGFLKTVETVPGVWEEQFIVRKYKGDVIKNINRLQQADGLNDNFTISNKISIIADSFVNSNFQYMRYIEFMGTKWRIREAEIQYPRIILTIGDVYNE